MFKIFNNTRNIKENIIINPIKNHFFSKDFVGIGKDIKNIGNIISNFFLIVKNQNFLNTQKFNFSRIDSGYSSNPENKTYEKKKNIYNDRDRSNVNNTDNYYSSERKNNYINKGK